MQEKNNLPSSQLQYGSLSFTHSVHNSKSDPTMSCRFLTNGEVCMLANYLPLDAYGS